MVIEDRVDPDKMRGVFDPKISTRGDYKGDLRKVPCTVEEEHIAADQIFPLIKTGSWYTPTIKHHCPRTAVASSLRACSNKVSFDDKLFTQYSKWFREGFIPKFMDCMSHELTTVDLESWLKRYPKGYRDQLRKSADCDHFNEDPGFDYEAFTKVEMQFTTVPHDLKETPLNDTKERQICGPTNLKKFMANAFINELEGIASKYFKPYCGRHNWMEICDSLEQAENELKSCVWGASDGSGFDMTQYPECNQLMNELITSAARHPNVHFNEPLCPEFVETALDGSLILNVSVDNGQLRYRANGRASGDGWTTFGNTMLMISYWMFTMHLAEIEHFALKVKGDDVLFAVQQADLKRFKEAVDKVFTKSKDEHKHGLGQICKKINYGDLTDLDFLSNEFFLTSEGHYRMTRIPARVIQTLSWTTKLPKISGSKQHEHRQNLCHSKGMCLKSWADGLPIFGVLADKMIELGKPGKLSCFDEHADASRVWTQGRNDYNAYLVYLEKHYNITALEVKDVENKIKSIGKLSGFIDLPCLERFYA